MSNKNAPEEFNYVYSTYGIQYMLAQHCKCDLYVDAVSVGFKYAIKKAL